MLIQKSKIISGIVVLLMVLPISAFALSMPMSGNELAEMAGINAPSYIVIDALTGQALMSKNSGEPRIPASLTKLVTAMVVLDAKTKLAKTVTMAVEDQTAGWCNAGGVCIKTKPGVKFTMDGLLRAALMPSANNAANALARGTGLSKEEFVSRMNEKAASLGATQTHFTEPTGMDTANITTAEDFALIVKAAFSDPYLRKIAALQQYYLRSTNNSRYNQTIKNNNKLLADADLQIIGAKTGYLNESQYNFAALLKYQGRELAIVVLGEQHLYTAFAETKLLAGLAETARVLALINPLNAILGTSTLASAN